MSEWTKVHRVSVMSSGGKCWRWLRLTMPRGACGLDLAENPLEDRVHVFGVIGYRINVE